MKATILLQRVDVGESDEKFRFATSISMMGSSSELDER